jgi:hypothetical protein
MARKNQTGGFFVLILLALPFAFCGRKEQTAQPSATLPAAIVEEALKPEEATSYQFVNAPSLNVRSGQNGEVKGNLKRGERVPVYEQQGTWARISRLSEPQRWISLKSLCVEVGCSAAKPKRSTKTATARTDVTPRTYVPRNSFSSGSCPCSGAYNCTGPRGGQYCITSGGNKRYRR